MTPPRFQRRHPPLGVSASLCGRDANANNRAAPVCSPWSSCDTRGGSLPANAATRDLHRSSRRDNPYVRNRSSDVRQQAHGLPWERTARRLKIAYLSNDALSSSWVREQACGRPIRRACEMSHEDGGFKFATRPYTSSNLSNGICSARKPASGQPLTVSLP